MVAGEKHVTSSDYIQVFLPDAAGSVKACYFVPYTVDSDATDTQKQKQLLLPLQLYFHKTSLSLLCGGQT